MAKYLFARYIWELTTIYRQGRITLKDLNERWRDCYLYDGKGFRIAESKEALTA